jgi:hypothetical protein
VYHESIKQNTGIGRPPAHAERTQRNHICVNICVCEVKDGKTEPWVQSFCDADISGFIEPGYGSTVCF